MILDLYQVWVGITGAGGTLRKGAADPARPCLLAFLPVVENKGLAIRCNQTFVVTKFYYKSMTHRKQDTICHTPVAPRICGSNLGLIVRSSSLLRCMRTRSRIVSHAVDCGCR